MGKRFRVLDAAPLVRRGVVVLELEAPMPLIGFNVGMLLRLWQEDGANETVTLKGVGFASSTPDHAHVIVTIPSFGVETLTSAELLEELAE